MNYGHPFPDDAPHPGNAVLRRGKGKPLWHKSDHRYGNKSGAADNGFVPSLVSDHQFIRCALLQHTFIALLLRDKLTFKRRQMAGQLRQKGQPFVERHRLEFFFGKNSVGSSSPSRSSLEFPSSSCCVRLVHINVSCICAAARIAFGCTM